MIDVKSIKACTNSRFYERGKDLYYRGKVLNIDVQEDGDWIIIHADVKGSGHNIYDIELEVDAEDGDIMASDCSCPAAESYYAMCKHCVAVAFEYNNQCENQIQKFTSKEEALYKLQNMQGITKGIKVATNPLLKNILDQYTNEKMLPILNGDLYGKIELEPFLSIEGYRRMSVEFKIGTDKKYVLKDLIEFVKNIKEKENHSYGKNLEFVHIMEAFSPDSRKMVKFIEDWVARNKNTYSIFGFYGNTYQKVRHIPLDENSLEEFLMATEYKEFALDVDGAKTTYKVAKESFNENASFDLKIQGDDSGANIKIQQLFAYKGNNKYMIFKENCVYMEPLENWKLLDELMICADEYAGDIYVSKEDLPSFCNILLPKIKGCCNVELVDFDESKYVVTKPELKTYLDMPQEDMITFKAQAIYGENEYSVFDQENVALRDLQTEKIVSDIIKTVSNAYDNENKLMVLDNDEEKLYLLLTKGIERLQQVGEVFVSDAIKKLQVVRSAKTTVGISLSGDLLELNITSDEMSMDELVDLICRYDRKKKYYKLKNGNIFYADSEQLDRLSIIKDNLQLTDREMKKGTVKVPKFRALYLDEQVKDEEFLKTNKSTDFKKLVDNIKSVEEYDFEIPQSLNGILRNYQKEGFRWIKALHENGFGGILADEMGLGKSLQVICFILSEMEKAKKSENKRTLIVCPASLVYNWKSEFEKFAPNLIVKTVSGNVDERHEMIMESGKKDILVTSYDLLKRDIEVYGYMEFFAEIIDEAQYIKNSTTQAAKAVKLINATFRLALTGTPVENRLSELWSEFDFLMPGFLFNYKRYKEQIEQPIVRDNDQETMVRLQKMISPFILRRLKKDVLKDLPDKVEENMYVKLEGEQQKLYDAHVKRMKLMLEKTDDVEFNTSKIQILAELTKLRQLCCDPAILFDKYKGESAKADMCIELIKNATENGHKILLFSQFTSMLENLQKRMIKEGISFYTLTGSTDKRERAKMVEQFNCDETSVFCISLKAGGTGLNLTSADIVIHYDPWWNVAVQNQATDRAHRIGQKNVVNVYKLITKGTIEEKIVNLQERKQELADKVLGGERIGSASFNKEELLELLG